MPKFHKLVVSVDAIAGCYLPHFAQVTLTAGDVSQFLADRQTVLAHAGDKHPLKEIVCSVESDDDDIEAIIFYNDYFGQSLDGDFTAIRREGYVDVDPAFDVAATTDSAEWDVRSDGGVVTRDQQFHVNVDSVYMSALLTDGSARIYTNAIPFTKIEQIGAELGGSSE